jgi:TnpA family transposase
MSGTTATIEQTQIAELSDPPSGQRELVRHYTFSETDLEVIERCRGDHNRLGHAIMRCYLRYPGRPMRAGERPPSVMLEFATKQIGVFPETFDEYLVDERNRQRHVTECQEQLGLRPFGKRN